MRLTWDLSIGSWSMGDKLFLSGGGGGGGLVLPFLFIDYNNERKGCTSKCYVLVVARALYRSFCTMCGREVFV